MESVTTSSQLINLKSSLAALASLWHDAGKYSDNLTVSDPLSHEWVSCLLFFAFIKSVGAKSDQDWLSALQASSFDEKKVISIVSSLKNPENFLELSPDTSDGWKNFPVALFVAWLILSHHSLPAAKATSKYCSNFADCSISDLNSLFEIVTAQMGYSSCDGKKDVLSFTHGLVFSNKMWQEENAKWAKELENYPKMTE
jgi:CRISPR-associated endonuclease/helicase Cas3